MDLRTKCLAQHSAFPPPCSHHHKGLTSGPSLGAPVLSWVGEIVLYVYVLGVQTLRHCCSKSCQQTESYSTLSPWPESWLENEKYWGQGRIWRDHSSLYCGLDVQSKLQFQMHCIPGLCVCLCSAYPVYRCTHTYAWRHVKANGGYLALCPLRLGLLLNLKARLAMN